MKTKKLCRKVIVSALQLIDVQLFFNISRLENVCMKIRLYGV